MAHRLASARIGRKNVWACRDFLRKFYLRLCIPESVGGDGRLLVDTALVYEELYTENASVALTLLGTMLGLQPLLSTNWHWSGWASR